MTARRRFRWLRGLAAVAALLASAVEVLVSALTGWPRASWAVRQLARPLRDAWRRGARTIPAPRVVAVTTVKEARSDG